MDIITTQINSSPFDFSNNRFLVLPILQYRSKFIKYDKRRELQEKSTTFSVWFTHKPCTLGLITNGLVDEKLRVALSITWSEAIFVNGGKGFRTEYDVEVWSNGEISKQRLSHNFLYIYHASTTRVVTDEYGEIILENIEWAKSFILAEAANLKKQKDIDWLNEAVDPILTGEDIFMDSFFL